MDERLQKQMAFLIEATKEATIERQTYITNDRLENDAEHAWHLALMAVVLKEYANEEFDLLRTISMLLIHDIVEIDAGDTFAYDEKLKETKVEREQKASERIFSLLPDDQKVYLQGLFDEYNKCETPEAKFAKALDKIQPTMYNHQSNGKAWKEHGVKLSQILKRNEKNKEYAPALAKMQYEEFIKPHIGKEIIDDIND